MDFTKHWPRHFRAWLATWELGQVVDKFIVNGANEICNFTMNFGNFTPKVSMNLAAKFTAMFELQRDMNSSNRFTQQGRSMPDNVRSEIVERWSQGNWKANEFAQEHCNEYCKQVLGEGILERGDSKHRNSRCKTGTSRTDDVVMYTDKSLLKAESLESFVSEFVAARFLCAIYSYTCGKIY